MAFRSVGLNLPREHPGGVRALAEDLKLLKRLEPGFVELWPENLGLILGGDLDPDRVGAVREVLEEVDLRYTVHAPLEVDLMDRTDPDLQRRLLEAGVWFAGEIGAEVVVCHAGRRVASRDARHSLKKQLASERSALREAGEMAAELGVTIAVENYYPDLAILRGEVYDYSVWPSELGEQVTAVGPDAVGICLDVGHAALAARALGFDLFEECAGISQLVRHLHLHDNLQRVNLTGTPPASEHHAYGFGDLHLPPGKGTIPLGDLLRSVDFPQDPTCCVELSPESFPAAPQALHTARELAGPPVRESLAS